MKHDFNQALALEVIGLRPGTTYKRFNLPVSKFITLLDMKLIDPEEGQNYSPTAMEFRGFIEEHRLNDSNCHLEAYFVGGDRTDARVTVEGIVVTSKDANVLQDFMVQYRQADEFDMDLSCLKLDVPVVARSWWD